MTCILSSSQMSLPKAFLCAVEKITAILELPTSVQTSHSTSDIFIVPFLVGMESKTSRHHLHTTLLSINPLSLTKKRRQLKVLKLLPSNKPPIKNPFCIPFQESCLEFERLVSAQCESLIQMIHERREFLIDTIRMDKETKLRTLKVGNLWSNFNWDKLLNFDNNFRSSSWIAPASSSRRPASYSSA